MIATPQPIADVLLLEPRVFGDERGFFFESFNARSFHAILGRPVEFVQDSHSKSAPNVLRGLHYQIRHPQGKLVRVVAGSVFDVAVDLRRSSPTFGQWVGNVLSAQNKRQMWIPPGFAHGFLALEEGAEFVYKSTDYYCPEHERCIAWDDAQLGVQWPLAGAPSLSARDRQGRPFASAEVFD